jgi:hypothetical protein
MTIVSISVHVSILNSTKHINKLKDTDTGIFLDSEDGYPSSWCGMLQRLYLDGMHTLHRNLIFCLALIRYDSFKLSISINWCE